MPRRAKLCDECRRFDPGLESMCNAGHRPRFYLPTEATVMNQQWGYKRRCEDFAPLEQPNTDAVRAA